MFDADYREVSVTALGTATAMTAQGADTPGAFVVPTNVSRITEIRIHAIPGATVDTIMGFSSGVHIYGSGVKLSEGWFPGPAGFIGGVATMTAGVSDIEPQVYFTNIPVRPGGQFSADAFMLGEDIGALHMLLEIIYDGPVAGKIVDMDYRSQDLTAANTLVTLDERINGTSEGDFKPAYGTIGEIFVGMGAKITAGTALPIGLAAHLSGPGLLNAGNYKFLGKGCAINDDSATLPGSVKKLERYICQITTKPGNNIRVQAQMIENDIGTAFAVVGFAYY